MSASTGSVLSGNISAPGVLLCFIHSLWISWLVFPCRPWANTATTKTLMISDTCNFFFELMIYFLNSYRIGLFTKWYIYHYYIILCKKFFFIASQAEFCIFLGKPIIKIVLSVCIVKAELYEKNISGIILDCLVKGRIL